MSLPDKEELWEEARDRTHQRDGRERDHAAAYHTVEHQVTDAVTQANVAVVASGPAVATVQSYLSLVQAQGVLFANMVANQAQLSQSAQATTAECVTKIFGG